MGLDIISNIHQELTRENEKKIQVCMQYNELIFF